VRWGQDRIGAARRLGDRVLTPRDLRAARRIAIEGAVVSAADQLRSITPEGYERLRAQLAELTTVHRSEVARWLRDARDGGGGLEDNLDHAEALDEHALLERRIATLRHTLALVEVIDYSADGTAGIGAHVRLRMPSGDTIGYQLVGSPEADPSRRRMSIKSPVGQAILGRRQGDIVDVDAPGGTHRIEILEIQAPTTRARAA
jgi:transcription elongation factor GreA